MRWTIENVTIARDENDAVEMLIGQASQVDYLGGRILKPSPEKPEWRVQTFFDANGQTSGWLPDGLHYRLMPESLLNGLFCPYCGKQDGDICNIINCPFDTRQHERLTLRSQ